MYVCVSMNVCMQVEQEPHEMLLDKSSLSCQTSSLEILGTLQHSNDYESFSLKITLTWFHHTFLNFMLQNIGLFGFFVFVWFGFFVVVFFHFVFVFA